MSRRKVFLVLLMTVCFIRIMAQGFSDQLLKVVPPSPNVAALGKYGEVPVSLYTGIPNISIPLYEIKDGNLELPITLSYHAGGVKVEEIASSVGLGWALNAGGLVGRTVRGLPDDTGPWFPQPVGNTVENIMLSGNQNSIQQLVTDVDAGHRDGEADIYYYNFNQFSGKFFYDQSGVVHTIPTKNFIITPIAFGWRITTEDGTVYTFNKVEEVRSASSLGDQMTNAAWFLTSIKSADGKREITFSYNQVNYTYQTLVGQTKYFSTNGTGSTCVQNYSPALASQNYNTHRLVRIDFGDGYIIFNYNTPRCDLMEEKSLDEVKVYSKNNAQIKAFKFGYSYFGNNSDGCNYYTKELKRLKLVSVTEENLTIQKPPYLFEYNESIDLPGRLSYAQDHWGYYNGKVNNPDLIAGFTTMVSSGSQVTFPGADRKANPETAQAGILTKIKYPTGGETLFTYESNEVSDNRVEPFFKVNETSISLSASNKDVSLLPYPYESGELIIPEKGAKVQFYISGFERLWPGCDNIQCLVIKDNNATPFLKLGENWNGVTEDWQAGTYKLRVIADCGGGALANFSVTMSAQIQVTDTTRPGDIRPVGGLRIKQVEDRPGNGGMSIVKRYKYHVENDTIHSSGVLVNFPDYGYRLEAISAKRDEFGRPEGAPTYCTYMVRQSFSNYPLATTQGSYVGYGHVIVDQGENGESSFTFDAHPDIQAGFPFAPVENYDWARGFLLQAKDYARKNGSLTLVKETINRPLSLNQFRTYGIKTGRNYYVIEGGEMIPYRQPSPQFSFYPVISEVYAPGQTKERIYDQTDPTKYIENVTDYTYSPLHLQLMQTKTVTSKSDQSTKEEIVSNKKYPFDYNFSGAPLGGEASGIKNLQDLHVVNAVIEEDELKQSRDITTNVVFNKRIIDGSITTYKSDMPYPDQIFKLETGAAIPLKDFGNGSLVSANTFVKNADAAINNLYKPAVIFNSYDDAGNITTQQKAADVKKSYIWGYNFKYPVAEVVGVDYATIMTTLNLDQKILQSVTASDEEMRTELNKIRTAFPAALVSTYTYKPLVGISSQTDPNNRTIYYEYDPIGRLLQIRDQDKNILKRFCYNYVGQPGNCAVSALNP